jgi:deferrochelatase/peroxidase EfeB
MAIFDPDSDIVTAPDIPGAPLEPVLVIDEIQGNVLPGFGSLVQAFIGLRFANTDTARKCLGWLLPSVSTLRQVNDVRNIRRRAARSQRPRPPSPIWTNVALSVEGLSILGVPTANLVDGSFKKGLYREISKALGDPVDAGRDGHVSRWRVGGSPERVPHILVIVAADDEEWVGWRLGELHDTLLDVAGPDGPAVDVVYEEIGTVLTDGPGGVGREHFGFRDGISTLAPRGRLSDLPRHFLSRRYIDPSDPRAKEYAKPGQPLVWPGSFVFGYARQGTGDHATAPGSIATGGYPWMDNGSLLVLRRLRQDVARFRDAMKNTAEFVAQQPGWGDMTAERLATLVVGRWMNGTALAVDPAAPAPDPMGDRLRVNHFGFEHEAGPIRVCKDPFIRTEEAAAAEEDPDFRTVDGAPADPMGARSPTFAHVRKVNPRDLPTDQGSPRVTLASQVLRRGITFGPPFPADGEPPDDAERGLLFLAYQTSIANQFEILTIKWMNGRNGPDLAVSAGHDLLVGQESGSGLEATLRHPGRADVQIQVEGGWVVPTGGGYFFSPSVSTLRAMATGAIQADA